MAVPQKPAAGAPIAADWGSVVHDAVVALDIQYGIATVNFANSAISNSVDITFPRPFAAAPAFWASIVGHNFVCNANNVPRVDGTNIIAHDIKEAAQNGNVQVSWLAIGPRA